VLGRYAWLLTKQKQYGEAKNILESVRSAQIQRLGEEHVDTLITRNRIAHLYGKLGEYQQAEDSYRASLAIMEKSLGPQHPDTLKTLNHVASACTELGKYEDAGKLYKKVLEGRTMRLGKTHPDTLGTIHKLGNWARAQGKEKEAAEFYELALKDRIQNLGIDHPDTQRSICDLQTASRLIMCVKADEEGSLGESPSTSRHIDESQETQDEENCGRERNRSIFGMKRGKSNLFFGVLDTNGIPQHEAEPVSPTATAKDRLLQKGGSPGMNTVLQAADDLAAETPIDLKPLSRTLTCTDTWSALRQHVLQHGRKD